MSFKAKTPPKREAFHPAHELSGLTVLKIETGSPPKMTTAWCGALRGAGSPMVTTTDGQGSPKTPKEPGSLPTAASMPSIFEPNNELVGMTNDVCAQDT